VRRAGDFDTVFYPSRRGPMGDLVEDKHSIMLIQSIEELAAVHESGIGSSAKFLAHAKKTLVTWGNTDSIRLRCVLRLMTQSSRRSLG
jgi:hypothetical protein